MSMTVEALAQEIISGHIIGPFNAKAVASQIFPFINRHIAERELAAAAYAVDEMQRVGHIAAGQQGAVGAVPDVKALANRILSTKTNNTDADDNALALIDVLSQAFGHDTISPAREWMEEAIFEALEATPQPADTMINGLTEAETAATASVMGLAKPAGAVPDPLDAAIAKGTKAWTGVPDSFVEDLRGEGAGRADAVPAWFGELPAHISNPEAWPANYAGGYNDALNMCYDVIRGHAPQQMTTQGEAVANHAECCAISGGDPARCDCVKPRHARIPSPEFEEWFRAIWGGSDDIPVPEYQSEGWNEYIAKRQLALGAWEAALTGSQP